MLQISSIIKNHYHWIIILFYYTFYSIILYPISLPSGYDGSGALSTCEYYSPENNTWNMISSMNSPRHAFSMTELQAWLYVAGGSNFASTEYNTAERYDPQR